MEFCGKVKIFKIFNFFKMINFTFFNIIIKPNLEKLRKITLEELAEHNTRYSLWMAVEGNVYDLTCYAARHPGGIPKLVDFAGKEATEEFMYYHPWINHRHLVGKLQIGYLEKN